MSLMQNIFSISIIYLLTTPASIGQGLSYSHYNTSNALPSNLIYCGTQDNNGEIWFGTDNGIASFNRNQFTCYGTKNGLPDPDVFGLKIDKKNKLWISCFRKGLCYLYKRNFYTKENDTLLDNIKLTPPYSGMCGVFEDGKSNIWVYTSSNIVYKIEKNKILTLNIPSLIIQVFETNQDILCWSSDYIYNLSNKDWSTQIFSIISEVKYPNHKGSCVNVDKILYSHEKTLLLLGWNRKQIKVLSKKCFPGGRVVTDLHHRFWLCSPAVGAICFDNPNRDLSNPTVYLPGKKVTYMFEDRQGTYWFCTLDEGVYALPRNAPIFFSDSTGNSSNNIISIHRASNGDIYYGDDEGNLNRIRRNKKQLIQRFSSIDGYNRILGITTTPQGALWVTTDEGLFCRKGKCFEKVQKAISAPKAILLDSTTFWYVSSSRLCQFSIATMDTLPGVIQNRFTSLGNDTQDNVWAGSIDGIFSSVDHFRKNQGERFPELNTRIIAIAGDPRGFLWIVTPENGLLQAFIQNGIVQRVVQVNSKLRKPVYGIQSVFLENEQKIWLATNTGIYGIRTDNWQATHFDQNSGLASNDVRSIVVYNDTLWAGHSSGVTRMILRPLPDANEFPTYFTSLKYKIDDNNYSAQILDSLPPHPTIVLEPNASLVDLSFTGLDYRNKGSIHFQCITTQNLPPARWWTTDNLLTWVWAGFQGVTDTTWIYKNNIAYGVNLPPGRYDLHITAYSTNEAKSNYPDYLTLIMPPKWYQTVWFSLLMWLFFAYVIWRIYRTRVQLHEMATAVAQSRLVALQAQINPHFVGNAVNAIQRFFYPASPLLASAYTAIFTRLLRRTLHFSERTFVPFEEEVRYNRDYMELATLRLGGKKFKYSIIGAEFIPPDLPFPSLFLQPVLENATIHGTSNLGRSIIKIEFRESSGWLFCEVTDNGPGLNATSDKTNTDSSRQSKGIEILRNKALVLNQLYNLGLTIEAVDLSAHKSPVAGSSGTKVTVSFSLEQARRAQARQKKIERNSVLKKAFSTTNPNPHA